jgi:hypothetical protein
MVDLLLKPAVVPADIYQPLFNRCDSVTGKPLTKRQMAPVIVDAVDKQSDYASVVRVIVKIAAEWTSFHLADDEFAAGATVQKARKIMGTVQMTDAREAQQRELAKLAQEKIELLHKHSKILLMMFEEMAKLGEDPQRRGVLLQELLNRVFNLHEIPVFKSFMR